MAKKKKMSKKAYINLKLKNCDKLILGATSDKQKEIYQGYREHWIGQLAERDNPDIIAEKKLEKERLAAEKLEIAKRDAEREAEIRGIEKQKEAEQAIILKQIEDLKKKLPNPVAVTDLGQGKTRYEVILDESKPEEEEEVPEENAENRTE